MRGKKEGGKEGDCLNLFSSSSSSPFWKPWVFFFLPLFADLLMSFLSTNCNTEDLQAQAGMFKKNATTLKKQMWWKQLRVRTLPSLPPSLSPSLLPVLGSVSNIWMRDANSILRFYSTTNVFPSSSLFTVFYLSSLPPSLPTHATEESVAGHGQASLCWSSSSSQPTLTPFPPSLPPSLPTHAKDEAVSAYGHPRHSVGDHHPHRR